MTMTANLHDITHVECNPLTGCANWSLQFSDDERNTVTMFVPQHVAQAIVAAWDASHAEPEPLDAETVAARGESYRRDMRAAGRGHLIGE